MDLVFAVFAASAFLVFLYVLGRQNELFLLSIRNGDVLVVRGRVPPAFLRAAPPIERPTLGQVLGIVWLAWLLDPRR